MFRDTHCVAQIRAFSMEPRGPTGLGHTEPFLLRKTCFWDVNLYLSQCEMSINAADILQSPFFTSAECEIAI